MRKIALVFCYVFLFSISCVDPFNLPGTDFDAGILVIDGFINSGANATTTMTLSRSSPLSYTDKLQVELKAKVTVEDDNNSVTPLPEKGSGTYSNVLVINPARKYRLRIKTLYGKEYLSDFVEVKQAPAIDSITYEVDRSRNAIEILINTHDAEKSARNYLWEFAETWEYHADCNDNFLAPPTYKCWRSENSNKVLFSTSDRLKTDVINHFPLTLIDANSIKLGVAYSILVKQYAVTDDALEYLQQLKKTTEQQGSIFDAQPAKVTGNFHCLSNTEEPVLGYLFAHNSMEKRIFLENSQLPSWVFKLPAFLACSDSLNPFFPINCPSRPPSACSDCRVGGGVIEKPAYWPN